MNTRLEPSTTMPSVPRKLGSVEMPTPSTATASLVWMCSAVCTKSASCMPWSVTCHTRESSQPGRNMLNSRLLIIW